MGEEIASSCIPIVGEVFPSGLGIKERLLRCIYDFGEAFLADYVYELFLLCSLLIIDWERRFSSDTVLIDKEPSKGFKFLGITCFGDEQLMLALLVLGVNSRQNGLVFPWLENPLWNLVLESFYGFAWNAARTI